MEPELNSLQMKPPSKIVQGKNIWAQIKHFYTGSP